MREHRRRNYTSVVGLAVATLLTDNVEEYFSCIVAIVAEDPHLQSSKQINVIVPLGKENFVLYRLSSEACRWIKLEVPVRTFRCVPRLEG